MKLFKLTVSSNHGVPARVEWVVATSAANAIDSIEETVIVCEFISNLVRCVSI